MIRNKSDIFLVYQGINQKRTENISNNVLRELMQFSRPFFG